MNVHQQYLNDAKQRYQEQCSKLAGKYPNLRNEDYKRWCAYPNPDSRRVACFQFLPDGTVKDDRFNNADSLMAFLAVDPSPSSRRLFVLESFNDKIRDLVSLKLDIDPQVFHRHTRIAIWESARTNAGNTPLLPSLIDSTRSWAMLYSQLINLNLEKQEFGLRCTGSERHIASSRYDGKLDGVESVGCKISFSGTRRGQDGWDVRTHVKPEVARATRAPYPWQGGYNDFIKYSAVQEAVDAGTPPRTSTFDDLCFYHTHHCKHLQPDSDPKSATTFAQKLVASEYMLLIEYNRFLLNHIGWKLSRRNSFEIFNSVWVEQTWSDLNSFQQRIQIHYQNIVILIANLELKKITTKGWMSTTKDFAHIEEQFLLLHQKAESLLNSFTGLSSMVGNRQSLNEARSVGLLTVLGIAFVPLSLVASLFSMADEYRPGAGGFWVYFAVSIPFVALMFAMVLTLMYWRKLRRQLKGILDSKK